MKLLVIQGYRVQLLAEDRSDWAAAEAVRSLGVHVCELPEGATIPRWFGEHGTGCGAVVVCRHNLASYWIPLARHVCPHALIVFDSVDLHHVREQREAEVASNRRLLAASRATRSRELSAVRNADVSWIVSSAEQALLERLVIGARLVVVPNIHDVEADTPGPQRRSGLLFVGGGRHPPNVDAVRWLLSEIFPRVRERLPDCRLEIVGEGLKSRLGSTDHDMRGITFHGHVPDLTALLARCGAGLAPLRFGAGVKGKVNQYMAHGLPTIATPCATEGMHLQHGVDVLIARGADEFVEAVVRLHEEPHMWLSLARYGKENVRRHFSFSTAARALAETFGKSLKRIDGP